MLLSNNSRGKTDHLPDEKRVRQSYCEILRPQCRSRAGKTFRCKIETIAKFRIPTSWKELARFLGIAGYYRNFCLHFSEIAAPLTNFLTKKFVWTEDCQLAFDKVKLLLQEDPVLKSPDYEKPFKLINDSSDVRTGSVL